MKSLRYYLIYSLPIVGALCSCSSEPLNAECDIVDATLESQSECVKEVVIINDAVSIKVSNQCDITCAAPMFELTPGATINPPNGTVRDFTNAQTYTVTSEDGMWHKDYTVSISYISTPLVYNFENIILQQYGSTAYKYDVFVEYKSGLDAGEPIIDFKWASGNEGFAWTGLGKTPEDYPTFQVDNGVDGKCLCLITRKTGKLANLYNKPLAAGNLFMGTFDMSSALSRPLESTHFGMVFTKIPNAIVGYYKYKPGDLYCELDPSAKDKLKPMPEMTDEFNIIGVLFDNTLTPKGYLDGTNMTAEDNDAIISIGTISASDRVPADDWTKFRVNFENRPGKSVDNERLKNGDYSLFLVFSSSINGDYFSGAEGSTLYIDKVELLCEDPE